MRELNLSKNGITDELLREIQFDADITELWLISNQIQTLDEVRFSDGLQELSLNSN